MKRTERCRQLGNIHRLTARGGFTLVEVLVVMAIMVILFGMLFVPLSSSIDMARAGQSRVQMQQQLQMAMQLINRGISGAQYILLPEYIPIENTPGDTADDTYLINYSNITFQPPGFVNLDVVRYAVMTQKYDIVLIGRPLIIYLAGAREEGVSFYLNKIKDELSETMLAAGAKTVKDIKKEMIRELPTRIRAGY